MIGHSNVLVARILPQLLGPLDNTAPTGSIARVCHRASTSATKAAARPCATVSTTTASSGSNRTALAADSPKPRSPVRMTRNPARNAASANSPLVRSRQPRLAAVSQSILRERRTPSRAVGRLTSSSHIAPVGQRGSEAQDLRYALARELRVVAHDILVRHSLREAGQDEGYGEARASDSRFAPEAVRVRNEQSVPRDRRVLHGWASLEDDTRIRGEVHLPP